MMPRYLKLPLMVEGKERYLREPFTDRSSTLFTKLSNGVKTGHPTGQSTGQLKSYFSPR